MNKEHILTSEEILAADDLYDLQDKFCCSGIPFKYRLTKDEYNWALFIRGRYCISDFVLDNTDEETLIMSFDDSEKLSQAINEDGMDHKAVMLSDDTALQKLFFWLSLEEEEWQ